jgi:hypothetical protein
MSRRRCATWLLAGAGAARLSPAQGLAEPAEALEQKVKAAYLYHFSSFVEWPGKAFAAANSPLEIGVMEADALAEQLVRTIAGRTVRGRPLAVRKLRRTDSPAELHLLFVGPVTPEELGEVLAAARHRPTLLVTQADGALLLGSMVNLVQADERLRFEVAPKVAEQSGLTISARLLAAALKVQGKSP